jgi:hypothetical protein
LRERVRFFAAARRFFCLRGAGCVACSSHLRTGGSTSGPMISAQDAGDFFSLFAGRHQSPLSSRRQFPHRPSSWLQQQMGFRKRKALLGDHSLGLALGQSATGSKPHQPHRDDDVGIPRGLRELQISCHQNEDNATYQFPNRFS